MLWITNVFLGAAGLRSHVSKENDLSSETCEAPERQRLHGLKCVWWAAGSRSQVLRTTLRLEKPVRRESEKDSMNQKCVLSGGWLTKPSVKGKHFVVRNP